MLMLNLVVALLMAAEKNQSESQEQMLRLTFKAESRRSFLLQRADEAGLSSTTPHSSRSFLF